MSPSEAVSLTDVFFNSFWTEIRLSVREGQATAHE